MISKIDILKMIKHVHRRAQGRKDGRIMHPRREWILILLCFITVFVSGSIYSAGTYFTYQNLDAEVEHPSVQVVEYQTEKLKELLQYYDERSKLFQSLRGTVSVAELEAPTTIVIDVPVDISTTTSSTTPTIDQEEDGDSSQSTEEGGLDIE